LISIEFHKCLVNILAKTYLKIWKEICNLEVPINNLFINLEIVVEIVEFLSLVAVVSLTHINKLIKVMLEFIRDSDDMLKPWAQAYNTSILSLIEFMFLI